MKWFTCCNALHLDDYWDMLRVAIWSARKAKLPLEPHFVFDGPEQPRLDWLRAQGVTVIRHRVTFEDAVRKFYGKQRAEIAMGCFLRTEIPLLCADKFVLYTDADVMFTGQPLDQLAVKRPPLFCAAPQLERHNWTMFNSGVLLLNLPGLRKELPRLPDCFQKADCYDQPALLALAGGRWSRLNPAYNHKPYWGIIAAARIVHFHGPKPGRNYPMGPGVTHATAETLQALRRGGFAHYEAEWKQLLAEVDDAR